MESVETPKKASPSEMAAQIKEIRDEVSSLAERLASTQPGGDEGSDLREQVRVLQLQIAAIDARNANADIILGNAQKVLDRLEAEKRKGGKFKWQIENHRFKTPATKNAPGKPAVHIIYSDATNERAALEDFRRRSGVQHDASDKDPFRAVLVEEAPQAL